LSRALLHRQVGSLLQQGEVTHHAGERRLEIVGEVGDQIVLAARLIAQGVGDLALLVVHAADRTLHLQEGSVEVVHILRVVDQAVDKVVGDDSIRGSLPAVVAGIIQRTPHKEDAAHRACEQEAAEHEQVIYIDEQRSCTIREQGSEEDHGEPSGAAERHRAADRHKAVRKHVAHDNRDEERDEALTRDDRK